jgi:RNA polymerase sigma-70 factor (ECF subfamily)
MPKNLENKNDSEIIKLIFENPDYFSEIIKRYELRLTSFIKRLFYFSKEDIQDLLQEIFLKVYKNLNQYDKRLKFSTWIYQVARNHTIDNLRKNKNKPKTVELQDPEILHLFKASTDLKEETEIKDNLEKIKKIINKLPFKYREVLILKFIEEKNYIEMQDIIKKPKGTIGTLVNRGKKLLIKELKKSQILNPNFKQKITKNNN